MTCSIWGGGKPIRLLTFYANGEQIPIGPKFSDPFELTITGPVSIAIPATGVSITCPSDPITAIFGWFESNSQTEDIVETNGYNAGPVRDCSGMTLVDSCSTARSTSSPTARSWWGKTNFWNIAPNSN